MEYELNDLVLLETELIVKASELSYCAELRSDLATVRSLKCTGLTKSDFDTLDIIKYKLETKEYDDLAKGIIVGTFEKADSIFLDYLSFYTVPILFVLVSILYFVI